MGFDPLWPGLARFGSSVNYVNKGLRESCTDLNVNYCELLKINTI